jgi:Protein of unknown function (DUF2889).
MISKSQAAWACSVDRSNDNLVVTSSLMSTDYEAIVYLKIDAHTGKIEDACWEVYRVPSGSVRIYGEIPELDGIGILSYSSRLFQPALDPNLSRILVELVSEGIRGILQSQDWTLEERDPQALEEFIVQWSGFFQGTCIRFSTFEKVKAILLEELDKKDASRKKSLFRRQKSYHIFSNPDGSLSASAGFIDAHHELLLAVSFSPCGEVTDITGKLLRSPHDGCREGLRLLPRLKGKNLSKMSKKEMANLVGGCLGCTHVLEMCYDLGLAMSVLDAGSNCQANTPAMV